MAYRVQIMHRRKDGSTSWRLVWETYEKGVRNQRHVPREEWMAAGFNEQMTLDEAKAKAKQINTHARLKRDEARRNRIQARLKKEDLVESAYLPAFYVEAFEESILKRFCDSDRESRKFKKFMSNWRAVKRLIRKISLDPSEYSEQPEIIYNYCASKSFSPEYVKKIRRILNLWGFFVSKRAGTAFLPLPAPTKNMAAKIEDAFFDENESGLASEPLTPEILRDAKDELREDHYNWLFISVWFGLRPLEIDDLHKPGTWSIHQERDVRALKVYQSKLTSVSRTKRWKLIPILFPEQEKALEIIKSGNFTRPLPKTIEANVGEGITCYGGRKNFTDLMLANGYALESVSAWMGHTSIETTWQKYKNRLAVSIKKS